MVVIIAVAFVIGIDCAFVVSIVVAVVVVAVVHVVAVFTAGDDPISKVVVKLHKKNCRNSLKKLLKRTP